MKKVPPVTVDTGGGDVEADTVGDIHDLMKECYVLDTTEESLCSAGAHTDVDKSFLGKVQKLAVRKGWRQ